MKNLITIIAVLFFFTTANAQITFVNNSVGKLELVGKANTMGVVHGKLETDNNGLWVLTYDYGVVGNSGSFIGGPSTWEVTFNASGEDIETLYNIFMGAFTSENPKGYYVKVNLGSNTFEIKGDKLMGIKTVNITGSHIGQSYSFTKKHIQTLFGKA